MNLDVAIPTRNPPVVLRLHVVEAGAVALGGWRRCVIGNDVRFSTEGLEDYRIGDWEPVIYDALLLAAAVEYCDRAVARKELEWRRSIQLRLPVHDPDRWNEPALLEPLLAALELLTGDSWSIAFSARSSPADTPQQSTFGFPSNVAAVLPYSDGLDSRAVGGLLEAETRGRLVRIRLGSVGPSRYRDLKQPFERVPYEVVVEGGTKESSGRSRGFKFAMIASVGAYLMHAPRIIFPESAQGALGPVLVPVGQAHADYRNHPQFTVLMGRVVKELFGRDVAFDFPRLWFTKGETLKAYADVRRGEDYWSDTRSCWQQSRQVSWEGRRRQCGICAACLLRRMSMHAAGLADSKETFIWQDLSTAKFIDGAALGFDQITGALREYGIAGVLHLDHLADIARRPDEQAVELQVFNLARALGLPEVDVGRKLLRVLERHRQEWHAFMDSVGPQSFLAGWASGTP